MGLINLYFSEKNKAFNFRANLIVGLIMYSLYGILDLYMLPENYISAWKVRFLFVSPVLIVPFALSYYQWFEKYLVKAMVGFMYLGQVGIFIIINYATDNEYAHDQYYIGLVLLIFVAAFIFRLSTKILVWLSLFTLFVFNLQYFFISSISNLQISDAGFAYIISSNTFLFTASLLAILGSLIIGRFQNIIDTEKVALRKALYKAEESDKIKTSFLNTMSHEIRTPLNGIIGLSNLLIEDQDIAEKHELLRGVNRQAYHLLDILTSMLDYSQLQTKEVLGIKKKISIKFLKKDIYSIFKFHQEKLKKTKIQFLSEISDEHNNSFIYTYFDKYKSVIDAIIENALKFSESGQVIIKLTVINEQDVVLSIKDDGIGIDDGLEDSLFKDFVQIETSHNRSYGGIGMGLSIANKIISLMEGEIWYKKNKERGTTFFISIPRAYQRV